MYQEKSGNPVFGVASLSENRFVLKRRFCCPRICKKVFFSHRLNFFGQKRLTIVQDVGDGRDDQCYQIGRNFAILVTKITHS
jgi:hypothetical protein